MGKFLKFGRVVIILAGRFAGKKAVILKCSEEGNKERKFGHALVAGLERAPRKVTKRMNQKKILKRTNMKPFIKYINLNHVMPTRYQLTEFKGLTAEDKLTSSEKRAEFKKSLKAAFQEKYRTMPVVKGAQDKSSHLRFFFKKLKF